VIARRMTPMIIEISSEVTHHLNKPQKDSINEIVEILRGW